MKHRNNQYPYSSYALYYFFSFWGCVLIRGWALINFFYLQVGAYSRWALIRDLALNRMNTVLTSTHQFNGKSLKKEIYI